MDLITHKIEKYNIKMSHTVPTSIKWPIYQQKMDFYQTQLALRPQHGGRRDPDRSDYILDIGPPIQIPSQLESQSSSTDSWAICPIIWMALDKAIPNGSRKNTILDSIRRNSRTDPQFFPSDMTDNWNKFFDKLGDSIKNLYHFVIDKIADYFKKLDDISIIPLIIDRKLGPWHIDGNNQENILTDTFWYIFDNENAEYKDDITTLIQGNGFRNIFGKAILTYQREQHAVQQAPSIDINQIIDERFVNDVINNGLEFALKQIPVPTEKRVYLLALLRDIIKRKLLNR